MNDVKSCLLVGVGGQGAILISKIMSNGFMKAGYDVKQSEVHGMAQRGGSVTSHVRIGNGCFSPLIPLGTADMIIAFEMCEAVRNLDYLKQGGTVIVNKKIMTPPSSLLAGKSFEEDSMINALNKAAGKVVVIDSDKICNELGSTKIVNTVLLGAAVKEGIEGITKESVEKAIRTSVKPKFVELNIKALG